MAAEVEKLHPDAYVLFDLFRDIEEKAIPVNGCYVECFSFEDHVTFRADNADLDFSFPEIIEQIRALTESYCINVEYMEYSNQWFITGKQQEKASVKVNKGFGTHRKNAYEILPEGTGYRMRSRFARFQNLPELMNLFFLVADIQTEDMLGLPVLEIEGGKAEAVVTDTTDFQKEKLATYVQRAEAIRKGDVEPYEDNMLKLTHEAKLLSIAPRLLYPDAPNDPDSKLNVAIRDVFGTWMDGAEKN